MNSPRRFRRKLPAPFTRDPKFPGTAGGLLMAAAPLPETFRISDRVGRSQIPELPQIRLDWRRRAGWGPEMGYWGAAAPVFDFGIGFGLSNLRNVQSADALA